MQQLKTVPIRFRAPQFGFARGWYAVADARDIGVGTLKAVDYLSRQLIVFRTREGTAQVADAYCPHLGAHLASHDGKIHDGIIQCPFHKWEWDGASGRCVHIPYAKTLPPGGVALTLYPTREVDGAVLMWYDPAGAQPGFEPFESSLLAEGGWELFSDRSWITTCPFSDIFENAFDRAHIVQLHHAPAMPAMNCMEERAHGLFVDYVLNPDAGQPPMALRLDFTGITLLHQQYEGDGLSALFLISLTPVDEERVEQRTWFYLPPRVSSPQLRDNGEGFVERFIYEVEQDFKVLDYKKHLAQPRLCRGDGPIHRYREYANQYFDTVGGQ